jgi:hypothetical protein
MAATGLGLSAGAGVLGGIAARQDSKNIADAYATNSKIAEQHARNQAAQEQEKYRRLAASQKALYGASGMDVNTGSPMDVLADTDAEGMVSAMQILYGGALESANWRQRAKSARAAGSNSRLSGILGGLETGLAGSLQWMRR